MSRVRTALEDKKLRSGLQAELDAARMWAHKPRFAAKCLRKAAAYAFLLGESGDGNALVDEAIALERGA